MISLRPSSAGAFSDGFPIRFVPTDGKVFVRTGRRFISIIASALLFGLAVGGGSAAGQTESAQFAQVGLEAHNQYRARHGTPPMTLRPEMIDAAQKCAQYYVEKQTIDHTCPHKSDAGENLYLARRGSSDAVQHVETAVQMWYDEISLYDYGNPVFSRETGHFTQVVWKASTELGIGFATQGDIQVVVALYTLHGNVRGEFEKNVPRPI